MRPVALKERIQFNRKGRSEMKMKAKAIGYWCVLIVLLLCFAAMSFAQAPARQERPLRDYLHQPPNSFYDKHGYSEDVFRLYNLIALKETCAFQDKKIKALEEKVAGLEKTVAGLIWDIAKLMPEPNEVTSE